jgi:hypothetical protein
MADSPHAIRVSLNRRAREVGIFDQELSMEELAAVRAFYDFTCLKCGKKPATSIDHVKALKEGGQNTLENLQLLCNPCNRTKGKKEEDHRKGKILTTELVAEYARFSYEPGDLENEDYSYEMNDEENSYKTGEMNQEKSTRESNLSRRGGFRPGAGRKPSEYTLLKRRVIAENVEDADRAFDLYVQIMDNPLEETQMRLAAADRVMDRVLGKATEHSQQERKIIIEIIRENPEQQSIGPITRLALGAGSD